MLKQKLLSSPIKYSHLNVNTAATFNQKGSPVWAYSPNLFTGVAFGRPVSMNVKSFMGSGDGK